MTSFVSVYCNLKKYHPQFRDTKNLYQQEKNTIKIWKVNIQAFFSDSACIQLEMDIETNSVLSEENIKSAIKFGIDSSDLTDTKEYTIAFLKRLLVQREKVDMNFT